MPTFEEGHPLRPEDCLRQMTRTNIASKFFESITLYEMLELKSYPLC